jgi:hypothetical protein
MESFQNIRGSLLIFFGIQKHITHHPSGKDEGIRENNPSFKKRICERFECLQKKAALSKSGFCLTG